MHFYTGTPSWHLYSFAMILDKYRITRATIAMFLEGDHYVAHLVSEGSVILVDPKAFNGDTLVNVIWAEKPVMLFSEDLRTRAEKITQKLATVQFGQ